MAIVRSYTMNKQSKWANYPALNIRSDVFFILKKRATSTGCENLQSDIDVAFQLKDAQGYTVSCDLQLRDTIVKKIYTALLSEKCIYKVTLDDYLALRELCAMYDQLVGQHRVTKAKWNEIFKALQEYDYYNTYDSAIEKANKKLKLIFLTNT